MSLCCRSTIAIQRCALPRNACKTQQACRCRPAPWMCHMNRNAGSTTAPTHLSLASSLPRPRPRFWQSMCSALTSQRISHFSGASALFEVHEVHGLKIYNTKTSVLHLKKSRKQFYSPLFFFCTLLPLRPMQKILFGPHWISVVAIPCVTIRGNRRVF